jgi:hypothetical protein
MSPYDIEILLHYHSRTDDWSGPSAGNALHRETMRRFVQDGLLSRCEEPAASRDYEPTERLHAYVEGLCRVPLPVQRWVVP